MARGVPASTALLLLAVVVALPSGPQVASLGAPRDAGVGMETSPPGDVVTVTLGFATKDHTIGAPLYALVSWNFAATPDSGTWTVSNCQTQAAGTTLDLFALGNGVGPGVVNVTSSRCLVAQPPGMQDLWFTGGSDQYANVSSPVINASVTVSGAQAAVFGMALVPVGVPTSADVATVRPLYSGLTTLSVGPVGCRNASDPNEGAKGCDSVLGANDGSEYFRSYAVASWGPLPTGATAAHAIAFHALCSQVATIQQDGISVPPSSPTGPAGTTVFDVPTGVTAWNVSNALNAGREYCIAVEATLANGTVQWSNLVPIVPVDTQPVGQFSGNQQFAGPFDVNNGSPSAGTYVANFGCENMPCRVAWGNLSLA
ncbi:MAG TPA: hypothetical protein VGS23_00340, partial [Thermoplasmata archaeon]|nr:hypothetical protein [Thermoplasmata archaeon]